MKILCTILSFNEPLLEYSIESLKHQNIKCEEIVIENIFPARKAFNHCMDMAFEKGYETLFLLPADCILKRNILREIIDPICKRPEKVFEVTWKSDDLILGAGNGGFVFNIKLLKDEYRFPSGLIGDMDFVRKIKTERPSWELKTVNKRLMTHHPIWFPNELWMKSYHQIPKYGIHLPKAIKKWEDFLNKNRKNKAVLPSFELFQDMKDNYEKYSLPDKNTKWLLEKWKEIEKKYKLKGDEFICLPGWENTAKRMLPWTKYY